MSGDAPPTAIFCAHDYLAIDAYQALRERGLGVPGDVSLAGYDDIDIARRFVVPLTTVSQDYFAIGRMAAEILVDRLRYASTLRCYRAIPPTLRVRASTAAVNTRR